MTVEEDMIELTDEQSQELEKPGPPRARDPRTNRTFVLMSEEVYERFKSLFANDTVFTTAELLDRVMAEDDAKDPHLAALQVKYGTAP